MTEQEQARASAIVAALKKRDGLHWPMPEYVSACLPMDDRTWAHAYLKTAWSCGIEYRGALYEAGVDGSEVSDPYAKHIGAVMGLLGALGSRNGALDSHQPIAPPEPGDGVLLDHVGGHLSGIVEVTPIDATSWDVVSIDGGQVYRDGSRAILSRHRVYHLVDGVLTASDADGAHSVHNLGTPMKVLWILRGGKLPVRLEGASDTDPAPPPSVLLFPRPQRRPAPAGRATRRRLAGRGSPTQPANSGSGRRARVLSPGPDLASRRGRGCLFLCYAHRAACGSYGGDGDGVATDRSGPLQRGWLRRSGSG